MREFITDGTVLVERGTASTAESRHARDWHKAYCQGRDEGPEIFPPFDYPPSPVANEQGNRSWKHHVQRPSLLHDLCKLRVPALLIYGKHDIRPSWPVEQVARLMPDSRIEILQGADHYLWRTQAKRVGELMTGFVRMVQ